MNTDALRTYGRLLLRLAALAAVVGGVGVLGMLGWQWQATAPVERIAVTGTRHAAPDTLRHLARVDTGTALADVDVRLVEDRVERHPWVESVSVERRQATRTLSLTVRERTPAGLVVQDGRPAYYVDTAGQALPLPDSAGYDVPLVHGLRAAYHPIRPVVPRSVRRMLGTLQTSEAAPLVSAVVMHPDSSLHLLTTPIGAHDAVRVQIGSRNRAQKLRRLEAFARQVLATSPTASIAEIDLRYDGQIIARKPPPTSPET
jgi:cell division protein FtsQ